MTQPLQASMAEATRLTAAGRLTDATALIQQALGGGLPTTSSPDVAPPAPSGLGGLPLGSAPSWSTPTAPPRRAPGRHRTPTPWPRRRATPSRPGGSAAPPSDLAGRTLVTSFTGPAGTRSYRLYVPSGAGDRALPLVVMLHGGTQTAVDFATGTRMSEVAEREGFLVAYPEQPPSANAQRCWNWFLAGHQQRGAGEPSLLAGIVEQIGEDHRVDQRRVFVAGLSAGGAMAAVLAATYPDVFAAAAVHSGLAHGAARDLPSAYAAMGQGAAGAPVERPVPLIVFHGDEDRTVSERNAEALVAQATRGRPSTDAVVSRHETSGGRVATRTRYAARDGHPAVERWTVHGAGHAWAGGDPRGSYVDPQGPDASREVVRFFAEIVPAPSS